MQRFALLGFLILAGCAGRQTVPLGEYNALKQDRDFWKDEAGQAQGAEELFRDAYLEVKKSYESCAAFHRSWERGLREAEKRTDK